jgi:hypothetical protein
MFTPRAFATYIFFVLFNGSNQTFYHLYGDKLLHHFEYEMAMPDYPIS